ncbi:phage tail protein [Photobacterium halotolerans]|uniref:Phage tail protein n=1 Tax=Photobacterium halotolerans TaxID=265726 RepID=A0A7X4WDI7_9GAMM|nr:phage tail protein [Photobacterium halotolerans]NAW66718.1 phage tail protein [Photobacterium halotolerans]
MSELSDFISVQPENRTILEESLEYAWHQILQQPSPYPTLKQPAVTHEDFVSLLAAERGVLDWQPGDTLAQRRATTDAAFAIHRKAGTRSGLSEALSVLGVGAVVTKGELPYSFYISAEVPDGALSPELYSRLNKRVESYKSERDSVSMETVRGSTSVISVGVMCETGIVSDSNPYTFEQIDSIAAFRIGVLAETYIICDSEAAIQ